MWRIVRHIGERFVYFSILVTAWFSSDFSRPWLYGLEAAMDKSLPRFVRVSPFGLLSATGARPGGCGVSSSLWSPSCCVRTVIPRMDSSQNGIQHDWVIYRSLIQLKLLISIMHTIQIADEFLKNLNDRFILWKKEKGKPYEFSMPFKHP